MGRTKARQKNNENEVPVVSEEGFTGIYDYMRQELDRAIKGGNYTGMGDLGNVSIPDMFLMMGQRVQINDFLTLNSMFGGMKSLITVAKEIEKDNPTEVNRLSGLSFFTKLVLSACSDEIGSVEERWHMEESSPPMFQYMKKLIVQSIDYINVHNEVTLGMAALVNAVHFQLMEFHNHIDDISRSNLLRDKEPSYLG